MIQNPASSLSSHLFFHPPALSNSPPYSAPILDGVARVAGDKMMQMLGFRGGGSSSSVKDGSPTASSSSPVFAAEEGTGPARPLRLVYCDEKGKFQMDPEAVAALHLVKGPIGVVSVCGRARQGKSFILNQVLLLPFPSPFD